MNFIIRNVNKHDYPHLGELIIASARELSNEYNQEQIESAIKYVFGVDSQLVEDGTYFCVVRNNEYLACGGWSKRKKLFGGDQYADADSGFLDPKTEAAKIRAFFVHPKAARQGVGGALIRHCEKQAIAAGFLEMEMMSTLPGIPLYAKYGYAGDDMQEYHAPNGIKIPFLPMKKGL